MTTTPDDKGATARPAPLDPRILAELSAIASAGLMRQPRPIDGPQDAVLVVDGHAAINVCSNDYLGLANHPALRDAATHALEHEGVGAGSSRLIAGNLAAHRLLEHRLADFHQASAALLFGSGYQANLGVLPALAGNGDAIFSDALNHASIIDGCRLSRAAVHVLPHGDPAALDRALAETTGRFRRRVVVTETIFSMDGDYAPLEPIAEITRAHGGLLVVDEAHAVGALGPGGRGLCAAAGVVPDVLIGTLGKAFGAFGAYAIADPAVISFLRNRARTFIFSTAPPPAIAAAAARAVQLCADEEGARLRARLAENTALLCAGIRRLGHQPAPAHIQPIIVGMPQRVMELTNTLLASGIYAQGVRPPTVPDGTSRLRLTVTALHTTQQIRLTLTALAAALGADEVSA